MNLLRVDDKNEVAQDVFANEAVSSEKESDIGKRAEKPTSHQQSAAPIITQPKGNLETSRAKEESVISTVKTEIKKETSEPTQNAPIKKKSYDAR